MRLSSIGFVAALALSLGACGDAPDNASEEPGAALAEAAISEQPDEAAGALTEDAASEDAATQEAAGESVAGEGAAGTAALIPARFQGVWDYVEGTCLPESDLRMEISGSEILFYESIGIVTDAAAEGDDVVLTLAMEGEGETWEQKTRLSLITEGTGAETIELLATSDGDAPNVPDRYPSKRCEG